MTNQNGIAAITIGRNEGARLIACLESLQGQFETVVYVDSGSSDGSVEAARQLGASVVSLDMNQPFTAARARNAGRQHLRELDVDPQFIQFLDGDCVLDPEWLNAAQNEFSRHPDVAVVCGRRRELYPNASIYNHLIDREWDTPIGEADACGGDALMRVSAFDAASGYNPNLIAGEEPELCVRLRQAGLKIMRIDAEMTLHDAALTRFGQWWMRAKRAGFAYANGAALHGAPPERHYVRERKRALIWGLVLPIVTIVGLAISVWALLLLLIWPLQVLRLVRRGHDLPEAVFLTLSKLPEAQGVLSFFWRRLRGGRVALIEYK